ncbi:MAG: hypothetical protein IID30_11870 [Planctomycetes bacterium]|nr:hypothetical protein [Planctomycetota bacterium]
MKTRQDLIEAPMDLRPHIVLLGAGASRAACPTGDAGGRLLPVMDDLIDVVGLQQLIDRVRPEGLQDRNFEAFYGQMIADPKCASQVKEIERHIDSYLSSLSLPTHTTIYDQLLVSLRPRDAVFTFNWDPFLFDAYQRNRYSVSLPEIFFLHGNVRIGACREHDLWGDRNGVCLKCSQRLSDVPLLYPIARKDYSNNDYIRHSWEAAKTLFKDAFTLTIFGYSAPDSDKDAKELLRSAWLDRSDRKMEHIEIIDIADHSYLHDCWSPFTPTFHYDIVRIFEQSRLARWPRRSGESIWFPMTQGIPCEDFPLPISDSLEELQAFVGEIARHEKE